MNGDVKKIHQGCHEGCHGDPHHEKYTVFGIPGSNPRQLEDFDEFFSTISCFRI